MYFSFTTIGIFDSMGAEAVDFITKQTELATLFTEQAYIPKIIAMKKDKLATTVVNLVSYDPVKPADVEACKAVGITLVEYIYVVSQGTGDKTLSASARRMTSPSSVIPLARLVTPKV